MWPLTSIRIVYRAYLKFIENKGMQTGAALAYYALFSIAPMLLIAIYITATFFGEQAARQSTFAALQELMNADVANAILDVTERLKKPTHGPWAPIIAGVVALIGALNIFFYLRTSLCTIWQLPEPHGNSYLGLLLNYLLAISMVFVVSLILLLSVMISMVLAFTAELIHEELPALEVPVQVIEFFVSLFSITILFALMYRILSGRAISWLYVLYGSCIASLLFTIGKTLLGLYLAYSNLASVYGASGSIVVFLIWIYYSSQILIFGAELIQARRTRHEWMK